MKHDSFKTDKLNTLRPTRAFSKTDGNLIRKWKAVSGKVYNTQNFIFHTDKEKTCV